MTFLEAATLLIPALTGIAITVDDGNSKNLKDFEQQYCFSPQLQPVYTAAGLSSFFESHSDSTIYEVLEPMGSWSIAFQVQKHWVLIGPYTHIFTIYVFFKENNIINHIINMVLPNQFHTEYHRVTLSHTKTPIPWGFLVVESPKTA